jgi:V-type H+-transporting ATPase subunit a
VRNVVQKIKLKLHAKLTQVAPALAAWVTIIKKEKAIYGTLNEFSYDQARSIHIAEAWCPTSSLPLIKTTLWDINGRAGVTVPTIVNQIWTNKTPPTFVRTNKFTKCFQWTVVLEIAERQNAGYDIHVVGGWLTCDDFASLSYC